MMKNVESISWAVFAVDFYKRVTKLHVAFVLKKSVSPQKHTRYILITPLKRQIGLG